MRPATWRSSRSWLAVVWSMVETRSRAARTSGGGGLQRRFMWPKSSRLCLGEGANLVRPKRQRKASGFPFPKLNGTHLSVPRRSLRLPAGADGARVGGHYDHCNRVSVDGCGTPSPRRCAVHPNLAKGHLHLEIELRRLADNEERTRGAHAPQHARDSTLVNGGV